MTRLTDEEKDIATLTREEINAATMREYGDMVEAVFDRAKDVFHEIDALAAELEAAYNSDPDLAHARMKPRVEGYGVIPMMMIFWAMNKIDPDKSDSRIFDRWDWFRDFHPEWARARKTGHI